MMGKTFKNEHGYSAVEALLILVALALVGLVAWYVHHATTNANSSYSIQETSQKPGTPKKNVTTTTTPAPAASTTTTNQ